MDTINRPVFTNELIGTQDLPRFEAVAFTPLHRDYWKVTAIGTGMFFIVVAVALGFMQYFNSDLAAYAIWLWAAYALVVCATVLFLRIAFMRKGYAFREHDVLFTSGVISHTTTVIPYNRIQHVALHEGFLSRQFNLAEIQVFTAGGSGSELEIPGIPKDLAENIKQLLMGKIQTAL